MNYTSNNEILKDRKGKLYFFLAGTAAISMAVCLYIIYLAIGAGYTDIAFILTAAVLIYIWPLLMMFITKYAQRHKFLKWLIDLDAADKRGTIKKNFIPL